MTRKSSLQLKSLFDSKGALSIWVKSAPEPYFKNLKPGSIEMDDAGNLWIDQGTTVCYVPEHNIAQIVFKP